MTYRGRVRNGRIELDEPVRLPEGSKVRVDVISTGEPPREGEGPPTLYESLEPLIGALDDAPPDLARNHDHYLYGVPKRP